MLSLSVGPDVKAGPRLSAGGGGPDQAQPDKNIVTAPPE